MIRFTIEGTSAWILSHKKASKQMINNVRFSSVIHMLGYLKMNLYEFLVLYPTLSLFKKRIGS